MTVVLVCKSRSGRKSLPAMIEGEGKSGMLTYTEDPSTILKDVARKLSTEL